jgi:hypothetical protein
MTEALPQKDPLLGWQSLVVLLVGLHLAALIFWLYQLAKTPKKTKVA